MRHRTILSTLLAIAAVVGMVVVGTATTGESHNRVRGRMDAVFVADSGVVVGTELVSYASLRELNVKASELARRVGTFDFGRNRVFGYAAFTPGPPGPIFGDTVEFTDRYELYDTTDFYTIDDDGFMSEFVRPEPIMSVYEWGFGSFAGGDFHALGVVTGIDADGIRPFRHVDAGNRVTWSGSFSSPTKFHATVKVYLR